MIYIKADINCNNRIRSSRRVLYGLGNVVMCEASLTGKVKSYLSKSVCCLSLLYGAECLPTRDKDIQQLGSAQGSLMK